MKLDTDKDLNLATDDRPSDDEPDAISVTFLAECEQRGEDVARQLAAFIRQARQSVDIATYDFRLSDPLRTIVAEALAERAAQGVDIRIAYDADKPESPRWEEGMDPAPGGTGQFVQSLGYPWKRIGGFKLMHHKYLIRDASTPEATVWTGSTNLTDDAWTLQENNIVTIRSQRLASYYARDFDELWAKGKIGNSGDFRTRPAKLEYADQPATVRVLFSPGNGPDIDYQIAQRVARAERRIMLCSMLINSSALIAALCDVLRIGHVEVSGIYDRTQMDDVLQQWHDVRHNRWKIGAVENIVETAGLAGKDSTPYAPHRRHDYMHNKICVVDDTVITGSYNFSHSAELNAENILLIDSPALADEYCAYIESLMSKYGENGRYDIEQTG